MINISILNQISLTCEKGSLLFDTYIDLIMLKIIQ